jgi:hypothetical protein
MKPQGSLPRSQEPSTGPYPEPNQSNPYNFNIIYPLRLGLPSGLFPSGFSTNILYAFLFSPICATCPAHYVTTYKIII